jgi:hypothetical protein
MYASRPSRPFAFVTALGTTPAASARSFPRHGPWPGWAASVSATLRVFSPANSLIPTQGRDGERRAISTPFTVIAKRGPALSIQETRAALEHPGCPVGHLRAGDDHLPAPRAHDLDRAAALELAERELRRLRR